MATSNVSALHQRRAGKHLPNRVYRTRRAVCVEALVRRPALYLYISASAATRARRYRPWMMRPVTIHLV